jgi:hypothetical protein
MIGRQRMGRLRQPKISAVLAFRSPYPLPYILGEELLQYVHSARQSVRREGVVDQQPWHMRAQRNSGCQNNIHGAR